MGWFGCEYLSGLIREKYLAISSAVGGWRRIRPALLASVCPSPPSVTDAAAEAADVDAPGSEMEALGRNVAANGDEAYKSCKSVRPKETTGPVAYTGIWVKRGKVLQQCTKAPICAGVAWVRRIRERVGICLAINDVSFSAQGKTIAKLTSPIPPDRGCRTYRPNPRPLES